MDNRITLEEILDPISPETFFKEYWGKKHLVIKQKWGLRGSKFSDLFTFDHLSKYLNRYPHVKSLQIIDYDGNGTRWCLDKHKKLGQPFLRKDQVVNFWKQGKTIVIPLCEYENQKLVDICFEFEKYFGRGCVNVYTSPVAGSKSFSAHGDGTENFLFHTHGKTKWTMYRQFLPNKPDDILEKFILTKGDLLYIPQGQFHKVEALSPRILCSIHFENKKNQSLEKFVITDDNSNPRPEWITIKLNE
jgi:ribosomal protein L16 Arg81 hydroxylase